MPETPENAATVAAMVEAFWSYAYQSDSSNDLVGMSAALDVARAHDKAAAQAKLAAQLAAYDAAPGVAAAEAERNLVEEILAERDALTASADPSPPQPSASEVKR